MIKIVIQRPRTFLKEICSVGLFGFLVCFVTFPFLIMYVTYLIELRNESSPLRSYWETYIIGMTVVMPIIVGFLCANIFLEYRKMKWYPYFFSPDNHFFIKVKDFPAEQIMKKLETQRWETIEKSSRKLILRYRKSQAGRYDTDKEVARNNWSWRSTDLKMEPFKTEDGYLICVCFQTIGVGKYIGIRTTRKSMNDRFSLIDELFPDADFYNQKWQKIDRQWNVIDANSLQGAPIVEFAKPRKIMGWNVD
ncbi:MAG: hypothetical protein HUU57_02740 [Bdellovibrio sp.]|jgi:hypothetical protein|nr:hypothetical protein [Bdellovibrio sp.]